MKKKSSYTFFIYKEIPFGSLYYFYFSLFFNHHAIPSKTSETKNGPRIPNANIERSIRIITAVYIAAFLLVDIGLVLDINCYRQGYHHNSYSSLEINSYSSKSSTGRFNSKS